MRKDDLRRYVIYRMKSLELLHFYLLLFDLNNKRYCPENMLGHDARMFASSIRTVTISWLATFVDQSRDGMNVFDLWRRLFITMSSVEKEMEVVALPLQGLSSKPIFDPWKNEDYARLLSWSCHLPYEQLYFPGKGVWTFLRDDSGKPKHISFDEA